MLSLRHHLLVLTCLLLLPLVVNPFDSSAELQILLGSDPSILTRLASHLIRWDSLHFLGLASPTAMPRPPVANPTNSQGQGGYLYEHSLAFQPGIVYLLRVLGYASLDGQWSATSSILLTSGLAVTVSTLHSVMLYQ